MAVSLFNTHAQAARPHARDTNNVLGEQLSIREKFKQINSLHIRSQNSHGRIDGDDIV